MVTQKHKKKGFEQKSEVRMYERAKEQIPNPAEKTTNKSRKIITGNMGNFAQQRDGLKKFRQDHTRLDKNFKQKSAEFFRPSHPPGGTKNIILHFSNK